MIAVHADLVAPDSWKIAACSVTPVVGAFERVLPMVFKECGIANASGDDAMTEGKGG